MTGILIDCLDSADAKLAVSPEGLRSRFAEIEAELHRSEVYRRALLDICSAEGGAESLPQLLKAVGREAIRLALRQSVQPEPAGVAAVPAPLAEENPFDGALVESIAPFQNAPLQPVTPPLPPSTVQTKQPAPLPKTNAADDPRAVVLRQIGQELQRLRRARSISLEQLHNQTRIPMHQLRALESGRIDQLPEDVYTRGFIRQAGNALGISGVELAASLPSPDAAKAVVPSWLRSPDPSYLSPAHLYWGYVALMAGAVGGLAWLTHSSAESNLAPLSLDAPDTLSQSDRRSEFQISPAQSTGAVAQPDLAPPETLSY